MNDRISPKYHIELVGKITSKLDAEYFSNKTTRFYLEKWHKSWIEYTVYQENFAFIKDKSRGVLDVEATLNTMDEETLIKIAIDLGIDTPDFIPSIPTFRNTLKTNYKTAIATFEKAIKDVEGHPDVAIGLANSALESIIKEILKDDRLNTGLKGNQTLYSLTSEVLKVFKLYPSAEIPAEITAIGSALLKANQHIEKLRSEKTGFHGNDNIIKDPAYAYFIINSVTTIGLFLNSYYRSKFPPSETKEVDEDIDDLAL